MTNPSIKMLGIEKCYGSQMAVQAVDLDLNPGESVALVGHNGAGKTTLMKLMLGLIRPSAGIVRVLGEDPAASSAVRARNGVGFLPETIAFNASMTGAEVITFFARLKGVPKGEGRDLLARVGLADAAGKRVGGYSKGMRQRLGLAQALLGSPRVLLLDEPTTGLDPQLRQHFYAIVSDLRDAGATVLLSSHALTELEGQTDRVAIMDRGRLIALGTIEKLRSIARLPVRMRISVAGSAEDLIRQLNGTALNAPSISGGEMNGFAVDLTCGDDSKMEVVRRAAAFGPAVRDIEIFPPTLDELYAQFLDGGHAG
ncbi:ABC transporter ATP-binding protein [Skermanella rosea]|uniref:ABC transporter ATP-binding protein n=1 Tax=Skermanella rosea TaxID=1817965 RepID=UPI0019332AAE|nr:ABC transporter ATP-binding protein [Skermanella rosea]UEM03444.1 ABC transporter ATP-binding protein [Skermanella rosea]